MLLPSHLRVSRHGVFHFRLVLPSILAEAIGQKEIKRSLGTRQPEGAKLLAYGLSARMLPLVRLLSRAMTIDPNSIDPKSIKKLIAEGLVIENGVIRATRLETNPNPEISRREMEDLANLAKATVKPAEGPAYEEAKRSQAALLAALNMPPDPARPKSLKDARNAFLRFKKGTAPSTRQLYERRLKVFATLAGGESRMLHLLNELDCSEIVEALNILPSHARDLVDAPTLLANPPEGPTIGAGTIRDHLTLFAAFFDWAIRSKHYAGSNPFTEAAKPKDGTASAGAEPFTQEELQRIFAPELFENMKRPYHFWGPLLGLFTGARSNELAQLRLKDFVVEDGIKCIHIVHDANSITPTRTKNEASERHLPIHPTLWGIGLQDYLDDLKSIGADRLFPTLPIDANGKREKYFSRDFNEKHLAELGIHQKRRKVFHSFRDTLTDLLTDADVEDFYIEGWLGHATQTVTGKHYRKKVPAKKLAHHCLPAMQFPFLKLQNIRYKSGQWNNWMKENISE